MYIIIIVHYWLLLPRSLAVVSILAAGLLIEERSSVCICTNNHSLGGDIIWNKNPSRLLVCVKQMFAIKVYYKVCIRLTLLNCF